MSKNQNYDDGATKVSRELNTKNRFIGPKALFDPNYVPDYLFDRQKEERYLQNLIKEAIIDEFSTHVSLYGIKGAGKTALCNKSVQFLSDDLNEKTSNSKTNPNKTKSLKLNKSGLKFLPISIDCEGKDTTQILFLMISALAKKINHQITPEMVLNSTNPSLLNLLKLFASKIEKPILFFLDSIEYANPRLLNQILNLGKSEHIITICSYNAPQSSPFLMDFKKPDFKIQMDTYSEKTLLEISKDRCNIAIPGPINGDTIEYMVDLICEFDKKVPGSCVRVLRELYPVLSHEHIVSSSQIRNACRYQFEGYSIDELGIAEFISESDIVERVFLDNICTYFIQSDEFYMPFKNIKDSYKMACESIEYDPSNRELTMTLNKLQDIALLLPSRMVSLKEKNTTDNYAKNKNSFLTNKNQFMASNNILSKNTKDSLNKVPYFLTLPPDLLHDMLDIAFGNF